MPLVLVFHLILSLGTAPTHTRGPAKRSVGENQELCDHRRSVSSRTTAPNHAILLNAPQRTNRRDVRKGSESDPASSIRACVVLGDPALSVCLSDRAGLAPPPVRPPLAPSRLHPASTAVKTTPTRTLRHISLRRYTPRKGSTSLASRTAPQGGSRTSARSFTVARWRPFRFTG